MTEAVASNSKTRFDFVGMLFALTIAEIAVKSADIVSAGPSLRESAPACMHLLLATVVVSSSWVGWTYSAAPGNKVDVSDVFSWPFVVLLLDVLLVVFYFVLVRGAEGPNASSGAALGAASAAWETLWIKIIFGGYLAWDLLTKLVMGSEALVVKGKKLVRRGGITALCLGIAFLLDRSLADVTGSGRVIAADASLIALVLLFRALKGWLDGKCSRWWPVTFGLTVVLMGFLATHVGS